ncbi:MAG TPA: hypothetical protein VJR24_04955 [Gemmatimonadaceae bacterium]|nr:hypothetical protein [Gemmatimonadaceae bacterium]
MRIATTSRLACSIGAATLAALAACNGDNPTEPRVVMPALTPPAALTGGSITVTYCAANAPIWSAEQDGTGTWKRVLPTSGSTFVYTFTTGKGGVATVKKSGTGFSLDVVFATLADFNGQTKTQTINCPGTKIVNGSVAHVAAGQIASVDLGTASAFLVGGGPTTFTLNNVEAGPRDLIAARSNTSLLVNSIIIRRSLNPTTGSTLPVLDFTSSSAFAPASAKATLSGIPTGSKASVAVLFFSPRGTGAALAAASNVTNVSIPYEAIPIAKLLTGEFQLLAGSMPGTTASRITGVWLRTIVNRPLAFGPALNTPTISSAATSPYYRPKVALASQTQYNKAISASYSQSSVARTASVFTTAAYLGAVPATWSVALPDLHAVSGFLTTWAPMNGKATTWNVQGLGGTLPFFSTSPTDGSTFLSATRTGSLTSP